MKRFKVNGGIMALSLILVIGIMGVGYAEWKNDINIFGHLSTGKASIAILESDSSTDIGENVTLKATTTEPGKIRIPFTIINNGTVPMKLEHKSDNIDFVCDELLTDGEAYGWIIADIEDKQSGSYDEEVNGAIDMIAMKGGWVESLNINAIVEVNIPLPEVEQPKDMASEPSKKEMQKNNSDYSSEEEKQEEEIDMDNSIEGEVVENNQEITNNDGNVEEELEIGVEQEVEQEVELGEVEQEQQEQQEQQKETLEANMETNANNGNE